MHTNLHAYIGGTPRGTLGYSTGCLRAVVLGELLAELVLGLRRAASPAQMWAGVGPFSPGADLGRGASPFGPRADLWLGSVSPDQVQTRACARAAPR
jgi:hypothetical protein